MITKEQLDHIRDLLADYRKAIVELTTAAPEDRMGAAYEFAAIDQTVYEMLASWVESDISQAVDDGWIEWSGGKCPVDGYVDIKLRGGVITKNYPAGAGRWVHDNQEWDIIAYRVVS